MKTNEPPTRQEHLFDAKLQPTIPACRPVPKDDDFGGDTYEPKRDVVRLTKQKATLFDIMKGGKWFTLRELEEKTGFLQTSLAARLRDFRKPQFGAHTVDRQYVSEGLWKYRLIVNPITVHA